MKYFLSLSHQFSTKHSSQTNCDPTYSMQQRNDGRRMTLISVTFVNHRNEWTFELTSTSLIALVCTDFVMPTWSYNKSNLSHGVAYLISEFNPHRGAASWWSALGKTHFLAQYWLFTQGSWISELLTCLNWNNVKNAVKPNKTYQL